MKLSDTLRFARANKGMTMRQLADKSGISASTISSYENEAAEPTFFNLCCLAKALDLDMNYLAGFCDPDQEMLQMKVFRLNMEIAKLHREIEDRFRLERECMKMLGKKE